MGYTPALLNRGHLSWTGTDSDGRYVLNGLPDGLINVEIESGRGYIQERVEVSVSGAEEVTGVDFELSAGASISGVITDVDTGLAIAGVEVRARATDGRDSRDVASSRTDSEGEYTLRGIPDGRIEVRVSGEQYTEQEDLILVEKPEITDVDFSLTVGAIISGRVTDADTGLPIEGAGVSAELYETGENHVHAHTDADGMYFLGAVPPGVYRIWFDTEGLNYIGQYYDRESDFDTADPFSVFGTQPVEINFEVTPGATISGRVFDGATGIPIPDMDVGAGPVNESQLSWTTTNSDGEYLLIGIPDGLIEIVVSGQGYIEVRREVTVSNSIDLVGVDF